ncbi:acyltransferase family protein [Modestobacter sp. VKM Ac-2985]|uniref:acyltransferase family protein n=1 Tax=Modestobacter sp. VKM Ac-2985 TaxID=3004139 RepID=UPI0022AB75FE|nr:acyltransferase [Modestobacter sp. VKM Ac-2985]MCZ2836044.1 acyltransferase [Modestobacter sp. VKM Ac-2985]
MTASTEPQPSHSRGLDALRGIAAVLVVLGHSRDSLFSARDLDQSASGVFRLLLVPTSFAQEAVAVFFVISGYLVGGQVLRQAREDRFRWGDYLAKRLSRLWIVLLPGLVLTAVIDSIAIRVDAGAVDAVGPQPILGLDAAACNALFLMPTRCATYGTNTSLWSLAYEFWFYVAFAGATTAWYAMVNRRTARFGLALVPLAISVLAFGVELLWLFPAWLVGVLVAEARARCAGGHRPAGRRTARRAMMAWLGSVALLLGISLASSATSPAAYITYPLVALGSVPIVWMCLDSSHGKPRRWVSIGSWVGGWSYSMYVFHRPIVVLGVVISRDWWDVSQPLTTVAVYVLAVVAIALTYPLYWLTERHTGVVRAFALRWFGSRGSRMSLTRGR